MFLFEYCKNAKLPTFNLLQTNDESGWEVWCRLRGCDKKWGDFKSTRPLLFTLRPQSLSLSHPHTPPHTHTVHIKPSFTIRLSFSLSLFLTKTSLSPLSGSLSNARKTIHANYFSVFLFLTLCKTQKLLSHVHSPTPTSCRYSVLFTPSHLRNTHPCPYTLGRAFSLPLSLTHTLKFEADHLSFIQIYFYLSLSLPRTKIWDHDKGISSSTRPPTPRIKQNLSSEFPDLAKNHPYVKTFKGMGNFWYVFWFWANYFTDNDILLCYGANFHCCNWP